MHIPRIGVLVMRHHVRRRCCAGRFNATQPDFRETYNYYQGTYVCFIYIYINILASIQNFNGYWILRFSSACSDNASLHNYCQFQHTPIDLGRDFGMQVSKVYAVVSIITLVRIYTKPFFFFLFQPTFPHQNRFILQQMHFSSSANQCFVQRYRVTVSYHLSTLATDSTSL